jgi:hypothetical protein
MPDPLTPFEWFAKAQEARDIGAGMRQETARRTMFLIAEGYEAMAMHAASVVEFGEPAVRCG